MGSGREVNVARSVVVTCHGLDCYAGTVITSQPVLIHQRQKLFQ